MSNKPFFGRLREMGFGKLQKKSLIGEKWRNKTCLVYNKFIVVCLFTARERIVGWYHTGPKLHHNDVKVNELIRRYCSNSVRKYLSWSLIGFILVYFSLKSYGPWNMLMELYSVPTINTMYSGLGSHFNLCNMWFLTPIPTPSGFNLTELSCSSSAPGGFLSTGCFFAWWCPSQGNLGKSKPDLF